MMSWHKQALPGFKFNSLCCFYISLLICVLILLYTDKHRIVCIQMVSRGDHSTFYTNLCALPFDPIIVLMYSMHVLKQILKQNYMQNGWQDPGETLRGLNYKLDPWKLWHYKLDPWKLQLNWTSNLVFWEKVYGEKWEGANSPLIEERVRNVRTVAAMNPKQKISRGDAFFCFFFRKGTALTFNLKGNHT